MPIQLKPHTPAGEWYNANELRSYPFADGRGDGVPHPVIVDIGVVVTHGITSVHVSSVYLSPTLVSVSVSGLGPDGRVHGLLATTAARTDVVPYRAHVLTSLSPHARGAIVFGDLSLPAASVSAPRRWTFDADTGALYPSAVTRVDADWVSSLVDAERGVRADGVVDLSGNPDFTTRLRHDSSGAYVELALNAGVMDRLASPCNTAPALETCGATPVRSINGVLPDTGGTITLRFT